MRKQGSSRMIQACVGNEPCMRDAYVPNRPDLQGAAVELLPPLRVLLQKSKRAAGLLPLGYCHWATAAGHCSTSTGATCI